MLILSIDTSTRGCSVALHRDGSLLLSYELNTDRSSSSMLTTLMQSAVEHAGFSLPDLDAVAVAKGPGSYTGLRVGVSTAKGLCYALDKPLIAINTLEAMAAQMQGFYTEDVLLCPMIDARRMEVYCAVFDYNLAPVRPTQALIVQPDSLAELLSTRPVVFFGDGAGKCKPLLGTHPNARFLSSLVEPSARTVGQLATEAFRKGQFEDIATFEPYYLKDFMSTQPRKKVPTPSTQE
ncbi:tRNA (adenosine(37)-N6)-threonylcarbamoyltransferase complex dimerization subunit type 1 TsaB [Telluribacter sp.]|jgi:tRNA threonylcarbamoyladenosine biosynthesis protein TsaB|uniref:tRNA (adenosine(37)-N6)-threonylcarbamoyltransferase complex dimerization subunit type 1 TsaB n=1 Tax=Telluribacter sp. TaxID=1978767 RepID=UPI002E1169AF|nr:tRNA (adenosine(37)-N6)-threonylcarbamoyltransferase complex dimerization subunit type 1 TsaB [Telluribacter sp.]